MTKKRVVSCGLSSMKEGDVVHMGTSEEPYEILRVPGGWIYTRFSGNGTGGWSISSCFVPLGTDTRTLNFDAAIRRIADALDGVVCGGVDTADEINPETGLPYGPGGHTGYALERAVVNLKRAHKAEWDRAQAAEAK